MKRFPREMWDNDRLPKTPAIEREERGVQEVILRARDWRGFELTDSSGSCIMYVELPTSSVTPAKIDELWDKLDELDPMGLKLA